MGQYVAGFDVGGSSLKAALFDPDDGIVIETSEPVVSSSASNSPIEVALRAFATLSEHLPPQERLSAIGIGTPGLVDSSGRVHGPAVNISGLQGVVLSDVIRARTGIPCVGGNDVNFAALAEARVRQCATMLFVSLGTGVGGGIIWNGNVINGNRGMAGEIGHVVVVPDGRRCKCGQRGCLEAYAGTPALLRGYRRKRCSANSENMDMPELASRAGAGDVDAQATFAFGARMIARAIGYSLSILAPEVVVVGGGVTTLYPPIVGQIAYALTSESFPYIASSTKVEETRVGYRAGIIGAALAARGLLSRENAT